MRWAAGLLVATRGSVAPCSAGRPPARPPARPLDRLGTVPHTSRCGAEDPDARCTGVLREASARAPFHLRGPGEWPSGDGVRHPQISQRVGVAGRHLYADQKDQEASAVMGEVIQLRALVLGYARLAPYAGHGQHTIMQALLSSYAHREGLALGTVYFDRVGSAPLFVHDEPTPAFTSLVAGLRGSRAVGVVVPSLDAFGDEKDKRIAELEDDLGVVVHVVDAEHVHDPATNSRP